MIDWVSCSFRYDGPPIRDAFFRWNDEFQVMDLSHTRPVQVEGSYTTTVRVFVQGGRMEISGNLVKFLSGQNLVGTDDLKSLIRAAYADILDRLGAPHCLTARRCIERGYVNLTRVDCTYAYQVGDGLSNDLVNTWLKSAFESMNVVYRGRGHYNQGMGVLRFGYSQKEGQAPKASRRSVFKFYNKWQEMKLRPPRCSDAVKEKLMKMALGTVRGEATYRGLELKRFGLERLSAWNDQTCYMLHRKWIAKMQISDQIQLTHDIETKIPPSVRSSYRLWLAGQPVQEIVAKTTFYRHRKELLAHGVDISIPLRDADNGPVVVPVFKFIEAKPQDNQDWEELFWSLCA